MYDLEVSDKAEDDLDKIISYIADNLASPQAAASFADEVYECYERLEENPYLFEECRDVKLKKEGYRRAVIKSYVVVYKIYDEQKLVIVHRFFYSRQNYSNLI